MKTVLGIQNVYHDHFNVNLVFFRQEHIARAH